MVGKIVSLRAAEERLLVPKVNVFSVSTLTRRLVWRVGWHSGFSATGRVHVLSEVTNAEDVGRPCRHSCCRIIKPLVRPIAGPWLQSSRMHMQTGDNCRLH